MRRVMLMVALLAVGGCKREPSFDDRYKATANEIEQRATRIDRQLDAANTPPPADGNAAR